MRPRPAALLAAALCMAALPAAASPAVEAMLRQAEQVRSSDPAQFQSLLGQLDESSGAASPRQREQLQYLKAYDLAYTGRFDLAIDAASGLFASGTDIDTRLRAGALMVNAYAVTRDFAGGLRTLDQTLQLVGRASARDVRHHVWSAAGVIHNQVGQFAEGKRFAERMLADDPSPRTRCFAGAMRLESLYNLGPLTEDEAAVRALVDDCIGTGEPVAANFARGFLARRMADSGRTADAIRLLDGHLAEVEATRYPRLIGEMHSLLAELNLAHGDRARAEAHAANAIARSSGIEFSLPLVAAHRVMYEAAMQRGDLPAALEHLRRHGEVDKAYLDTVKAREMAYQMVRQETQQKTQEIELLNNQNRVLQLEQKVAKQAARNVQLLVALLVVLLASIGYWAFKTKRTQVSFRKLAETDALTGVSNRHHFSRRAGEVLEYCRRTGEDVSLVMFDLDKFKGINDDYGHAVGDWVLEKVSEVCRGICRKHDLFGRLGGEEFAFLLVGADVAAATELAQLCRARIRAIDTAATGHDFRISASFGVATSATAGHDFHPLLARADEAMYRAKRDGRDRVAEYVTGG